MVLVDLQLCGRSIAALWPAQTATVSIWFVDKFYQKSRTITSLPLQQPLAAAYAKE
jgi:hypothetical protein